MKLTEADKKVLSLLFDNAREPVSWLSRKSGLTREVVGYSMKKLENEGLIKAYRAKINQPYFCEGAGTLYLKLVRTNKKRYEEILNFLKEHRAVNWVAETTGNADLIAVLLYKNSEDLADSISSITQFIGENLKEHSISIYISEIKFTRRGLIYEKEEKLPIKPITFKGELKGETIDKKDSVILTELSKNCRIKNSELAKLTGLSEDMVRIRIKNLEKKEIIFGYTVVIDVNILGYESYYMGLDIENMSKEVADKIKAYVWNSPYIIYASRTAGKYNMIFNISAKNRQHFREILLDIGNKLGEHITNYEIILNIQEHKEVFVPDEFIKTKIFK